MVLLDNSTSEIVFSANNEAVRLELFRSLPLGLTTMTRLLDLDDFFWGHRSCRAFSPSHRHRPTCQHIANPRTLCADIVRSLSVGIKRNS